MAKAIELTFPAIVYYRGDLSAWPKKAAEVYGMQFPDSQTMLCKASARKNYKEQSGWLVDLNGQLIEFHPTGFRRAWLQPLSFVFQFVQAEYSITCYDYICVGDLLQRLGKVKDKFREAPTTASLRGFLSRYPADTQVTKELLEQWPI